MLEVSDFWSVAVEPAGRCTVSGGLYRRWYYGPVLAQIVCDCCGTDLTKELTKRLTEGLPTNGGVRG